MTDQAKLIASLTKHEAFKSNLYVCPSGMLTFGIGRNLEANPLTAKEWRDLYDGGELAVSISRAGAERLLAESLHQIERQCEMTFSFWKHLNAARQNVLVEIVYNLGMLGFLKFRNALAAIGSGDYGIAAEELLDSRWRRQVGQRAVTLAEQFRTGEF